jgi:hypothetical protein
MTSLLRSAVSLQSKPDTRDLLRENTFSSKLKSRPLDWNLPFNNVRWYSAMVYSFLMRKGQAWVLILSILDGNRKIGRIV